MKRAPDRKSGALVVRREYGEYTAESRPISVPDRGELAAGCPAGGGAPALAAPSLSKEEQLKQDTANPSRESKAHKVAFCVLQNIERLMSEFGLGRLAFLTLTFADKLQEAGIASKRFNSLNTGLLAKRGFGPWVRVLERHGSGAIHYHLIIVVPVDIRTGYDPQTGRGFGAGWVWLCKERRLLRKLLPGYSFGRAELVPLKKGSVAAARYLAKYITKSLAHRRQEDRRVRLVTYSRGFGWLRPEHFSWASGGSRIWRQKLNRWAFRMGYYDLDEVAYWMGARWCYEWRRDIIAQPETDLWIGPFSQYHKQLIPSFAPWLEVGSGNESF